MKMNNFDKLNLNSHHNIQTNISLSCWKMNRFHFWYLNEKENDISEVTIKIKWNELKWILWLKFSVFSQSKFQSDEFLKHNQTRNETKIKMNKNKCNYHIHMCGFKKHIFIQNFFERLFFIKKNKNRVKNCRQEKEILCRFLFSIWNEMNEKDLKKVWIYWQMVHFSPAMIIDEYEEIKIKTKQVKHRIIHGI